MNRLEFNEVLKALHINNHVLDTSGRYGSSEAVHSWKNVIMYFGGSDYAIVAGKIPLEVADIIYEKYPNNPYGIRIDGGCSDYIPNEYAVDEQFEEETFELIDQSLETAEYEAKYKEASERLLERSKDNKYIKVYHIDSKEGFIILLTELKDYYARKKGLAETEVQKYDEILAMVTAGMLKKVKPDITTYDWMAGAGHCGERFLDDVEREKQTPFGKSCREIIEQFDRTVNPYINDDIELDSIDKYLQKVSIGASVHDEEYGQHRKDCCRMTIKSKDGNGEVGYYRSPRGFSYQLMYALGSEEYLSVVHYFSDSACFQEDRDEHIFIEYFGDNVKQKVDLRYNITQGLAGETYGSKFPVTSEQIAFVYDELVKATEFASKVTIDNMRKNEHEKKLVIDEKQD